VVHKALAQIKQSVGALLHRLPALFGSPPPALLSSHTPYKTQPLQIDKQCADRRLTNPESFGEFVLGRLRRTQELDRSPSPRTARSLHRLLRAQTFHRLEPILLGEVLCLRRNTPRHGAAS